MISGSTVNVSINSFDAIILSILALSALVAFFRGFIRELLSLGAWVGAALVTIYLFPRSTEFMKAHIHGSQSAPVSAGIGALGTYIAALLVFSLINNVILRYVKTGAEVGLLDNFLGLIFGALRGAFIISLGYLILSSVIRKDNPPEWLKTSTTRPYVEYSASLLAHAAPKYLHDIEGFVKQEEENARRQQKGRSSGDERLPDSPDIRPPQSPSGNSYNPYTSPNATPDGATGTQ